VLKVVSGIHSIPPNTPHRLVRRSFKRGYFSFEYLFFAKLVSPPTDPVDTVHAATDALDPTLDKWNGR